MSQPTENTQVPDYAAVVPPQAPEPPVQEEAKIGPLGRLTGVIFSPGETFQDINRKPTIIAAFLIAMVTYFASSVIFEWRAKPDWNRFFQTQARKQMERSGQSMTPETQAQIDKSIEWQVKFAKTDLTSPVSIAFTLVRVVFAVIFYCVIPAGIFALVLMLMQAKTTFKKVLSVVSWSTAATGLIGAIVFAAVLMVQSEEQLRSVDPPNIPKLVPTNLGILMPEGTSKFLQSIAGSMDLFSIWYLFLISMGFSAISGSRKITTGKAATAVVGLWLVWVLIQAGLASMFG